MNPSMKLYFSFLVITVSLVHLLTTALWNTRVTKGIVPPPLVTKTSLAVSPHDSSYDTHPGSPLFFDAVDNGRYVDHTSLIVKVIRMPSHLPTLVAAPPRFGKTMNLDMIHNFFRIPFSSNGTILPAKKSAAYNRFVRNSLHITQTKDFSHFASRPVLYLNFKPLGDFKNLNELAIKFRHVLQEAVNSFPFIRTNLEYGDFRSKCFLNNGTFDIISTNDDFEIVKNVYQNCLDDLLKLLKDHFGNYVLLLIDEASLLYQNLLNNANCFTKEVAGKCIEFLVDTLHRLYWLNSSVWKSYLAGVIRYSDFDWDGNWDSHNDNMGYAYADQLEYESIFSSRNFLPFYGFSQQEVDSLYEKRKLKVSKETSMSWIKRNLKGYRGDKTPAGEAFYCPGDIVFLLYKQMQTDEPKVAYYKTSGVLQPFSNILAPGHLGMKLFSLSERGFRTPFLNAYGMMHVRDMCSEEDFHQYLLDHGFLTIISKANGREIIAVSNEVMRETLEDALMQVHYFKELYGIPDRMIQAYQDSVINLDNSQESVEKLTRSVADLFWTHLDIGPAGNPAPTEDLFHASAYCFLRQLTREFSMSRGELLYNSEHVTETGKSRKTDYDKKRARLDLLAFRKNDRVAIIFEIRHDPHLKKEESALEALEQIKEKNCVGALNLTEYSPVIKYILVGMHLDDNKCECSVLHNTEDLGKHKTAVVNRSSQLAHHK